MARPALLDKHPDLRLIVAREFVDGASNQAIADAINAEVPNLSTPVNRETITHYRRHPEVEAIIARLRRERINLITSKIDAKIEAWLTNAKVEHDMDTLLKVRAALMPERMAERGDSELDSDKLVEEMFDRAAEDPDFADRMKGAVETVEAEATADAS